MQDWLGMALFALGLGLIVSAVFKRRSRLRTILPAGELRPEYAAMGQVARPLVLFFVALFALKMSLFYFVLGGQKYLTGLDFAGVLFVLASYAGWLVAATTRRRIAAPVPAAVDDELGHGHEIGRMRSAA